jgi:superfamily II DNA or RNA helicase
MSSQPLRRYQQDAYDLCKQAAREGARRVLLVKPTGAGKTRTAAEFIRRSHDKGHPVVVLTHRRELRRQMADRLLAEGIPRVGQIAPDQPLVNARVQVASIDTLVARKAKGLPPAKLVVFDEAHHSTAPTYRSIVDHYIAEGAFLLGLTATPERGDGAAMGDVFERMVATISVSELQALGVLVPCVTHRPDSRRKADDIGVHEPVAAYMLRTPGERAFVFCQNIEHAEQVAQTFLAEGIPAATIHEGTSPLLREARIAAFSSQTRDPLLAIGSTEPPPMVLCNVYALTEGVDVPAASVCIIARSVGHPGMLLQMVGRVGRALLGPDGEPLRNADGEVIKERCTLIDLSGATLKHGLWEADREWSLEGSPIKLSESEKKKPSKPCPKCTATVTGWATDREGWRICPCCRERVAAPLPPSTTPRELHEAGGAASSSARERALIAIARRAASRNGNRAGWVAWQYKRRFGEFPPWGAADAALRREGIAPRGGEAGEW